MPKNNDVLYLHYFKPFEFGPSQYRTEDWWHEMCPRLLVLLDTFRFQWGRRVRISNNAVALGRKLGLDSISQHNFDRWGEVRAADCFPDGLVYREDARFAIYLARELGFTGIGLYPHWNGGVGLHLDTRRDRQPGDPALWGAVNGPKGEQQYVSLETALLAMSVKPTDTRDSGGRSPQDYTEQHPTGEDR